MRRFRYRLQTLLDYAAARERVARRDAAVAATRHSAARDTFQMALRRGRALGDVVASASGADRFTARELGFALHIQEAFSARAHAREAGAAQTAALASAALLECRRQSEGLERHRLRTRAAYDLATERQLDGELAEQSAVRRPQV